MAVETAGRANLSIHILTPAAAGLEKNESLAKRSRREVASLLEQGKVETARIRTESLILSDQHNELCVRLPLGWARLSWRLG